MKILSVIVVFFMIMIGTLSDKDVYANNNANIGENTGAYSKSFRGIGNYSHNYHLRLRKAPQNTSAFDENATINTNNFGRNWNREAKPDAYEFYHPFASWKSPSEHEDIGNGSEAMLAATLGALVTATVCLR